MACHSNSLRGDGAGAGEENNLGFGGCEGEATSGPPLHQTVHSTLDAGDKEGRVIATAEDRTVVSKCNPKGIFIIDEADGFIEGQGPEASRANTALGEAHAGGMLSSKVSVVISHVTVQEVVIVPSNDTGVGTNPCETALDVLGGDRVEGTPNVKEGSQTVRSGVDVAFDIVNQTRHCSLGRLVTTEPMSLGVEGAKADTLVYVPRTEPLQGLQKVIGEGNRAIGDGVGVRLLVGLGEKDHGALPP